MSDTREIEYTQVPNTKGKSDLWKHFNLRKRKTGGQIDAAVAVCKQFRSFVKQSWRHLKHSNAYEALPSLTVAWVT